MVRQAGSIVVVGAALIAVCTTAPPAWAACTAIASGADLEKMRDAPDGNFCITSETVIPPFDFKAIADFSGTLDGQGHLIFGQRTNLFDTLSGTVKNLRFESAKLDAHDGFLFVPTNRFVGIVAANFESGVIADVSVEGSLELGAADTFVTAGGIVGFAGFGTEITRSSANVDITADSTFGAYVGAVAGRLIDAAISKSHAEGRVVANSKGGGLAGSIEATSTVSNSTANVIVEVGSNSFGGGLVAFVGPGATIDDSFSQSSVTGLSGCSLGGLVGTNFGTVNRSVATGTVDAIASNAIGGFIADNAGTVTQSLATGRVIVNGGLNRMGGFFGGTSGNTSQSVALGAVFGGFGGADQTAAGAFSGETFMGAHTEGSYGIGNVSAGPPKKVGGFNGVLDHKGVIVNSYWTPATTGLIRSDGGDPLGTGDLLARLQPGFSPQDWEQTRHVSPPYLDVRVGGGFFIGQLATVIKQIKLPQSPLRQSSSALVYVFPPLGQFDDAAYANPATHKEEASLATVYTILARGIGTTDSVAELQEATIDTFFDDATQKTRWTGPIKKHATRGPWTDIGAADSLGEANVIGPIRARQVVIVSGTYDNGEGRNSHYLLATSFTDKKDGTVTGLVADDPWTGQQVLIDPISKAVTSPRDFPLHGFKVKRFQTVTLD